MAKSKKSLFRRVSNWLHLWLGLFSGVVVFVVCLTAAIWVFRDEMIYFFTPGQQVAKEEKEFLKPSELMASAKSYIDQVPNDSLGVVYGLQYRNAYKSTLISYSDSIGGKYKEIYLNPYSGKVLYHRISEDGVAKFNDFLRSGHRFFWLPRPFGSYFVGSCCIIFLITLLTGLIWWYPNKWNKSTRDKSFKIKWGANWKRVNIDLHNVLGFYTLIFTVILTVTGVVFTFRWFDDGYHWVITGGKQKLEHVDRGVSDTTIVSSKFMHPDDEIWARYQEYKEIKINYPRKEKDVYTILLNPSTGHNDLAKWYSFDQKTLAMVAGIDQQKEISFGQKIYKANFDIHVGTIGGLTTKIIAAIASLVGASLPVTGFIIWYNRKWGKKKKKKGAG